MQMFSFWLSTLAPSLKAANAVSYGIVLFAIVVQSFVSDNNLLKFIFSEDTTTLIVFLKTFLMFYPPFSYTKVFFCVIINRYLRILLITLGSTLTLMKGYGKKVQKIMNGEFTRRRHMTGYRSVVGIMNDIPISHQL